MTTGMPRLLLLIAGAENAAELLKRIPVAMIADGYKGKLKFSLKRADLGFIVRNYRKREADLVIDYDHSTEFAAGGGEPVPAAGG